MKKRNLDHNHLDSYCDLNRGKSFVVGMSASGLENFMIYADEIYERYGYQFVILVDEASVPLGMKLRNDGQHAIYASLLRQCFKADYTCGVVLVDATPIPFLLTFPKLRVIPQNEKANFFRIKSPENYRGLDRCHSDYTLDPTDKILPFKEHETIGNNGIKMLINDHLKEPFMVTSASGNSIFKICILMITTRINVQGGLKEIAAKLSAGAIDNIEYPVKPICLVYCGDVGKFKVYNNGVIVSSLDDQFMNPNADQVVQYALISVDFTKCNQGDITTLQIS